MSFPENSTPFKLDVKVLSASDLTAKDTNGLSDPYCKLSLARDHFRQFQKTKVITKTLNPEWNQEFIFYPQFEKSCLLVTVWDRDLLSKDDFLGCVKIPLINLTDFEEREMNLPLQKVRLFKFVGEEVKGSIKLLLKLERIQKKRILAYYNFQDPFDSNSRYKKRAKLRDCSGSGHHGLFKNLETDNVVQALGMSNGSYAGKFSGFNYIELKTNPLECCAQWSISIWFLVEDPRGDHVLLSAMTSDPKDVKLKKNVKKSAIQVKEYGKTASAARLPVDDVEETKAYLSGLFVCTRGNMMFDNFGRSLMLSHESNRDLDLGEDMDILSDDIVFCPEHFPMPKNKKKSGNVLVVNKEEIEDDDDTNLLRISLMKKRNWNHLVLTYDGASLKEYLNGVLVDDAKCSFEFLGYGKRMQLGGWDNDMALRAMKGLIDNLRIFNYVLSKSEVEKLLKEKKKK